MKASTVLGVLALAAVTAAAQYRFPVGWPSKTSLAALQVDSSAPGLLPPGVYALDLQVTDGRLVGRLHQGTREIASIPFSVKGCDAVTRPNWARRATARGLPPADGGLDRRVELQIADAETRSCVITGIFTADNDPQPGGRPNPGIPDQALAVLAADLRIRAAKRVPHEPKQVQVDVYNTGPGPSKPTQVKLFAHKNGKVTTSQSAVPMLAAKASTWVTVDAGMAIAAADAITARVDDPNIVAETNELNNGFKIK